MLVINLSQHEVFLCKLLRLYRLKTTTTKKSVHPSEPQTLKNKHMNSTEGCRHEPDTHTRM